VSVSVSSRVRGRQGRAGQGRAGQGRARQGRAVQCRADLRKKHVSRSCPTGCTPSAESQHSGGCPGPAYPPCHDPKCTSPPCGSLVQHASSSQPPVAHSSHQSGRHIVLCLHFIPYSLATVWIMGRGFDILQVWLKC